MNWHHMQAETMKDREKFALTTPKNNKKTKKPNTEGKDIIHIVAGAAQNRAGAIIPAKSRCAGLKAKEEHKGGLSAMNAPRWFFKVHG